MKKIIFSIFVVLFPGILFAYDPNSTHLGITEQVIEFYNLNSDIKINSSDKELIIQGARDEDTPSTRSLNHFYDPTRGIGINDYRTTLDWILEQNSGNDFSWQKGLEKYATGDRNGALIGLGHILHLLEDMTVPDHTRNDPHIASGLRGGYTGVSVYENWSSKNRNREDLVGLVNYYNSLGLKIKRIGSVKDYFNNLAFYSNNNYVSPDSIENSVYQYSLPVIYEKKNGYAYGVDSYFGDKHKIYTEYYLDDGQFIRALINNKTRDFSVLEEYFSRLSKQAILAGAGMIELFFSEAENARREFVEKEKAKQEEIITYEEEKAKKLAEGNMFSRLWYKVGYSFVEGAVSFFNPLFKTVTVFGSSIYQGSSLALNFSKNFINLIGFTTNELAAIGSQKIGAEAQKVRKAVVATSKKVILYTKENNNSLSFNQPSLNLQQISQLFSVLSLSTDTNNGFVSEVDSEEHNRDRARHESNAEISESDDGPIEIESNISTTTDSLLDPLPEEETASASSTNFFQKINSPVVLSATDILNGGSTTTILFSGTGEPDSIISNDLAIATTTVDSSGVWSLSIDNFGPGTTTLNFFAEPSVDHLLGYLFDSDIGATTTITYIKSDPTEAVVFVDNGIDISVSTPEECQNSILLDRCLIMANELAMSWNSNSSTLDHYVVSLNGEAHNTNDISEVLILNGNAENLIEIFAVSNSCEESDHVIYEVIVYSQPIVISQVYWLTVNSQDAAEQIILLNQTPYDIDLENWSLSTEDDLFNLNLNSSIKANGEYVLVRKTDSIVLEDWENQVFSDLLDRESKILDLKFFSEFVSSFSLELQEVFSY